MRADNDRNELATALAIGHNQKQPGSPSGIAGS
jgi:hypothetical protein